MNGSLAFIFGLPLAVAVLFFALSAYERRRGIATGPGFFQRHAAELAWMAGIILIARPLLMGLHNLLVNQAIYEMLNSANQAWTMYPGLSHGAYEALARAA